MGGISAVIPAAGRGERLGRNEPKAFVPLGGVPLLAWSLATLERCAGVEEIIVAAPADEIERVWRIGVQFGISRLTRVVVGGSDRQSSVLNAMSAGSPSAEVFLAHDAARPFTPGTVFARCAAAALDHGSASAALRVADTLREGRLGEPGSSFVDRSRLVRIQTPQAVRANLLRSGMEACREVAAECTDDSAMVEKAIGLPPFLVEGSEWSLKVTTADDLRLAEALVQSGVFGSPPRPVDRAGPGHVASSSIQRGSVQSGSVHGGTGALAGGRSESDPVSAIAPALAVGMGYDVHPFDENRPMVLCGVPIPGSPGLKGHSDADVALHAVCDAYLGAVGERDIGYHFPNTDHTYANADSSRLLQRVVEIINDQGWRPSRIDVTLIAEKPRVGPHVDAMRRRLAGLLGIAESAVAVKATTNEKMGFVGRGEGIACFALATLVPLRLAGE